MAEKQPITYADSQPDLPQSDFAKRLAKLRIARLFAERSNDNAQATAPKQAQGRGSSMVETDHPFPRPRPRSEIADEVDTDVFTARWDAERLRAKDTFNQAPNQGDQTMSDDNAPNRPEETLREGPLKAAIWRNENDKGAYHSVTLARTYKDRDGNLQDTSNFRPQDMLGLSELARRAHHHAHDLDRELFKEQRRQTQSQSRSQSKGR